MGLSGEHIQGARTTGTKFAPGREEPEVGWRVQKDSLFFAPLRGRHLSGVDHLDVVERLRAPRAHRAPHFGA